MSRRQVIAGNWKMHKTVPQAAALARAVADGSAGAAGEVVVLPPFTALAAVADALKGTHVRVGAQDLHWEREGAYTGEVSAAMVADVGGTHACIGHSERRQLFGEDDVAVAKKTRAALDHGLTPIVCVGETLAEREASRTLEVVERQTERALRTVTPDETARILLAYEPVWAIGTGRVATPAQAQEVHASIRRLVARSHGDAVAAALRILYGGSVKADNVAGLLEQADVDGALVGGASLSAEGFLPLVRAARG